MTTAHVPFHVCGSQQDNSTLCLPSAWNANRFGFGEAPRFGGGQPSSITEGSMEVAYRAGGGEPGYIAPDPKDIDVFFSGTNNGRYLDRYNRRLGTSREVNPYPWFYSGEPASEMVERWQWTFPIIFSPIDPNVLYTSSNRLWKTTNGGDDWEAISGDLTRADPMTLGHSGGPITGDMNGPEVYATIFSVGPGKVDIDVIWAGSDDGLVHVTRDGGATWTNVTPPDMPDFGRVSQIDASAFEAGRAYISVRKPLLNDRSPYIWKTDDYGATWTKIVDGIRDVAYVHAVREDPNREGLLYAGTQHGMYVSYDDGANWQELNPGFPDLPVSDVIVEHNELAIASHGRGFWVLDNLAPLRQARPGLTEEAVALFDPATAYRSANGATLSWWFREAPQEARLEILDASGGRAAHLRAGPASRPGRGRGLDGRGGRGGADPRPRPLGRPRDAGRSGAQHAAVGPSHRARRDLPRHDPVGRAHDVAGRAAGDVHRAADGGRRGANDGDRGRPASVDRGRDGRGPAGAVRVRDADPGAGERGQLGRDRHPAREVATRRPARSVGRRRACGGRGRPADGRFRGRGRHLPGAEPQQPGPAELPDPGEQPAREPALDVGAGRRPARERDVRRVRDHGGRTETGYTTRLDEVWRVELAAVNRELERLGLAPVDPTDESVELVS